ncbi:hypothetical protein F5B21DRAFT_508620 [Xylaria acuta]|nr:hypothetical protein F5B21DRAFT_508620 [Xylaria acuta]
MLYEAAQHNVCELQTDLSTHHDITFPDCATTRLTAPATIEIVTTSTPDRYPGPNTPSFENVGLKHLLWIIPMPLFIVLFIICSCLWVNFCRSICSKKRRKEHDEEVASERPHPPNQVDMGMEPFEKGPQEICVVDGTSSDCHQ